MPTKLGGGSGSLPIDTIMPLNNSEEIHTASDGSIWLRSGIITNDFSAYPLAGRNLAAFFDNFFSYSNETAASPQGVASDGSFIWVITSTQAFKYNLDGTYTGTVKSISGAVGTASGAYWNGSSYLVVDQTGDKIEEFDVDFNSLGTLFALTAGAGDSNPEGITSDGSFYYIPERANSPADSVYIYNLDGSYTGNSFNYGNEGKNAYGIAFAEGLIWVLTADADIISAYTPEGDYTGIFFGVRDSSELANPGGLSYFNNSFWIIGLDLSIVSEFEKYIGLQFLSIDSDSQRPLFVRVA